MLLGYRRKPDDGERILSRRDEIAHYVSYFQHFAANEPLFVPESEVATRIASYTEKDPLTRSDRADILALLASLDGEEHYDGSGWHGFQSAVRNWLDELWPTPDAV